MVREGVILGEKSDFEYPRNRALSVKQCMSRHSVLFALLSFALLSHFFRTGDVASSALLAFTNLTFALLSHSHC